MIDARQFVAQLLYDHAPLGVAKISVRDIYTQLFIEKEDEQYTVVGIPCDKLSILWQQPASLTHSVFMLLKHSGSERLKQVELKGNSVFCSVQSVRKRK